MMAFRQDVPARYAVTLERGLRYATKLRDFIEKLPDDLRINLEAAGLETNLQFLNVSLPVLIMRAKSQIMRWKKHVAQNRPAGEKDIGERFRQDLMAIFEKHAPNTTEKERRRRVAEICKHFGAKYPNEKKDRKRFLGQTGPSANKPRPKPRHK
jgi:hypothetical protein